jgi:hypothetical protein
VSPRDRILDDLLDFSRICRTRARNLPRNKPTIGILALRSLSSSDQGADSARCRPPFRNERDHLGILGEIKSVHPGEIIGIRNQGERRVCDLDGNTIEWR